MSPEIDRNYLLETLQSLVRIDSTNPSLSTTGAGESEIAAFVADGLLQLGMDVQIHETEPGRPSVVGVYQGKAGGRSLMLNAHTDTVGVDGMADPFSARIDNGRLFGRGSQDMKGSLAACMSAVKALVDEKFDLRGQLLVAAVADEEFASIGTTDIASRYPVDGAIVTEPTNLDLCLAHKGFIWLEVVVWGKAAHGSRFEDGIDANMLAGRLLGELDKLEQDLRNRAAHPLVGPPSMHVATVHGGTEWSTYAERCVVQIERRTIPGEEERGVVAEITSILDQLSASDPEFRAELSVELVRDPFEVAPNVPLVETVQSVTSQLRGQPAAYVGHSAWMDAAILSSAGVETVVLGPTGQGLHANEEWVEIDSVVLLARILAETAVSYCGVQR